MAATHYRFKPSISNTAMNEKTILCVDDEKTVLISIKEQLKKRLGDDFIIETAESGDEALEILEELVDEETEVLIIVSDWLMPGMKGDEFLIEVHKRYPKIVKVMLTGQADPMAINRAKSQANLFQLLSKPWNEEELINTIKSGLATHYS
jgi:CheY-like chemotaxis protein